MKLPPIENPFCDKLVFGFSKEVIGDLMPQITQTLNHMVEEGTAKRLQWQRKNCDRFEVVAGSDRKIFFEANPTSKKANWGLKIKYNPSKYGAKGSKRVRRIFGEVLGVRAESLLRSALIYEIDIAYDILRSLETFGMEVEKTSAGGVWGVGFGAKARVLTVYCGSSKSALQTKGYNKKAQLRHEWRHAGKTEKKKLTRLKNRHKNEKFRTRLEESRKFTNGIALNQIGDIPVPFGGLKLYSYDLACLGLTDPLDRQTLALAKFAGLQYALNNLEKDDRARLRRRLSAYRVTWWDPDQFIGAVKECLLSTGLFAVDTFQA